MQQEIVEELEGYQKVIDGCMQVVKNYKPTIDIDPSWEMVELGELALDMSNGLNFSKEQVGSGTKIVGVKDLFYNDVYAKLEGLGRVEISNKEIQKKKLSDGDILFVRSSVKYEGVGYTALIDDVTEDIVFAGFIIKFSPNLERINPYFLCLLLRTPHYRKMIISLGNRGRLPIYLKIALNP